MLDSIDDPEVTISYHPSDADRHARAGLEDIRKLHSQAQSEAARVKQAREDIERQRSDERDSALAEHFADQAKKLDESRTTWCGRYVGMPGRFLSVGIIAAFISGEPKTYLRFLPIEFALGLIVTDRAV